MAPSEFVQVRQALPDAPRVLDAHRALRAHGHRPLLLHSGGRHPESRHSHLACDPVLEVRIESDRFILIEDGERHEHASLDPLQELRGLLDRHRHDVPGFTGGWVGYFGHGAARLFDPTLPAPRSPPGTPDVVLRLCRTVVTWSGACTVFSSDLKGDAAAAQQRMDRVVEHLRAGPPVGQAVDPIGADVEAREHRGAEATPTIGSDAGVDAWTAEPRQEEFEDSVRRLQVLIEDGDHFQANLAIRFRRPLQADPADLLAALQASNPGPYMALLEFDDHAVVSASPEQLLAVEDGTVRSRPIAGTRRRGRDADEDAAMEHELCTDVKEDAEHTMLVDLVRNDIARVCRPGTVHVPEMKQVERYRHVMHLVSRVEGTLREGTHPFDVLRALFPGGTVTGAPKHRACVRIHEEEPVPRGPYTGSAGFIGWDHEQHWNILIRTLVLAEGQATVHAGSGIVAGSVPRREWREAQRKAQALLEAAGGASAAVGFVGASSGATGVPGGVGPKRTQQDRRAGQTLVKASAGTEAPSTGPGLRTSWSPPPPPRQVQARVLLVDNVDSFVHNLADHAGTLGAEVHVVRNDTSVEDALAWGPTHILLSPGPGRPEDAGLSLELARGAHGLPVLGVCLGHQAIAHAHGARIVRSGAVHGHAAPVRHDGSGLFEGLPSPMEAARYHSLSVTGLPDDLRPCAWLDDGTLMAFRHVRLPLHGVQFHPESFRTHHGLALLARFLEGP